MVTFLMVSHREETRKLSGERDNATFDELFSAEGYISLVERSQRHHRYRYRID